MGCTGAEGLLAAQWPAPWADAVKSCGSTGAKQSVPDLVVDGDENLTKWCYVGKDVTVGDPTRNNVVFYGGSALAGRDRVHVRVQGFITKIDVRPLGNWEG